MTADIPTIETFWDLRLRQMPVVIKLLFTAVLLTLGMGYIFAVANVALSVGVSQVDIVEHYWGDPEVREAVERQNAETSEPEAVEEEMSFDEMESDLTLSQPALAIPSFDSLVTEGHFHMFGFAMIFFICGLIISFAEMSTKLKGLLIVAPFVGSVFDIWSTLLTRFVGLHFSWMLMASGSLMATSFAVIFFVAMYQMWFSGRRLKNVSKPLLPVVLIGSLVLVGSTVPTKATAQFKEIVTLKTALKESLQKEGAKSLVKKEYVLTAAQKKEIKEAYGFEPHSKYRMYTGLDSLKNPVGVAVIIDVEGKEGPLQMVVAMRPGTGEVYNLGFTVFGEERGKPAANPSFLSQFIGADFEKPFILGKDVDGITGATRTSAAVNRGVKEAVIIHHYLVIQEEGEEEQ